MKKAPFILLLSFFIYFLDTIAALGFCDQDEIESSCCIQVCSNESLSENCSVNEEDCSKQTKDLTNETKDCTTECINCPLYYITTLVKEFSINPPSIQIITSYNSYQNTALSDYHSLAWKPPNA